MPPTPSTSTSPNLNILLRLAREHSPSWSGLETVTNNNASIPPSETTCGNSGCFACTVGPVCQLPTFYQDNFSVYREGGLCYTENGSEVACAGSNPYPVSKSKCSTAYSGSILASNGLVCMCATPTSHAAEQACTGKEPNDCGDPCFSCRGNPSESSWDLSVCDFDTGKCYDGYGNEVTCSEDLPTSSPTLAPASTSGGATLAVGGSVAVVAVSLMAMG